MCPGSSCQRADEKFTCTFSRDGSHISPVSIYVTLEIFCHLLHSYLRNAATHCSNSTRLGSTRKVHASHPICRRKEENTKQRKQGPMQLHFVPLPGFPLDDECVFALCYAAWKYCPSAGDGVGCPLALLPRDVC